MALTAARLIAVSDKIAALILEIKPQVGASQNNSTPGIGDGTLTPSQYGGGTDYGCHLKANDLLNIIMGWQDYDLQQKVAQPVHDMRQLMSWQQFALQNLQQTLSNLNSAAGAAGITGVTSIDSFATYFNTGSGGTFTCMFCPDFEAVYTAVFSSQPLSPVNCYSPAIANMGQLTVGGALVPGTGVNTALYGGVAACQAVITGFTGAAGTLTVTGTNHAGTAGRIWTVNVTGNGTFTLVPNIATDILQSVQNIAFPGSITAGTAVIAGIIPAGRSNPPT